MLASCLLEPRRALRPPLRRFSAKPDSLFLDRLEPPLPLRDLGVLELRSLALLALRLQLAAELLEALRADAPQMAQLEIDHRVGGGQRVRQQALEPFELLLSAKDRAFLLLELVEELEPLAPQSFELAFDVRPVPIELQQLLGRSRSSCRSRMADSIVGPGFCNTKRMARNIAAPRRPNRDSKQGSGLAERLSAGRARHAIQAVTDFKQVVEPLVQQHVEPPAPIELGAAAARPARGASCADALRGCARPRRAARRGRSARRYRGPAPRRRPPHRTNR